MAPWWSLEFTHTSWHNTAHRLSPRLAHLHHPHLCRAELGLCSLHASYLLGLPAFLPPTELESPPPIPLIRNQHWEYGRGTHRCLVSDLTPTNLGWQEKIKSAFSFSTPRPHSDSFIFLTNASHGSGPWETHGLAETVTSDEEPRTVLNTAVIISGALKAQGILFSVLRRMTDWALFWEKALRQCWRICWGSALMVLLKLFYGLPLIYVQLLTNGVLLEALRLWRFYSKDRSMVNYISSLSLTALYKWYHISTAKY